MKIILCILAFPIYVLKVLGMAITGLCLALICIIFGCLTGLLTMDKLSEWGKQWVKEMFKYPGFNN